MLNYACVIVADSRMNEVARALPYRGRLDLTVGPRPRGEAHMGDKESWGLVWPRPRNE